MNNESSTHLTNSTSMEVEPLLSLSPSLAEIASLPATALLPDAPIYHLLSIQHNPLVKDMSVDELKVLVSRLRALSSSPPTLSSKLTSDSDAIKPRNAKSAVRKALLDTL